MRRNGSASAFTAGVAFTRSRSEGEKHTQRRHDQHRETDRGEERLVHGAVDLVFVAGAGKPRDEHAHAREERVDEDNDDDEDLPRHADRRVAGVAHEVADQGVVDDALQPAEHVGEHGRPRELPDHGAERPLDDGPVVPARRRRGGGRRRRNRVGGLGSGGRNRAQGTWARRLWYKAVGASVRRRVSSFCTSGQHPHKALAKRIVPGELWGPGFSRVP